MTPGGGTPDDGNKTKFAIRRCAGWRALPQRVHDDRLRFYVELLSATLQPAHHASPAFRNFVARQYLQEAEWRLLAADPRSRHYAASVASAHALVQQAIAITPTVEGAAAWLARCDAAAKRQH